MVLTKILTSLFNPHRGETNHLKMVTEQVRQKGPGALARVKFMEVLMDVPFFPGPNYFGSKPFTIDERHYCGGTPIGINYGLAPSVVSANVRLEDGVLAISEPVEITSKIDPWVPMALSSLELKTIDTRVIRNLLDQWYSSFDSYTLQDGGRLSDKGVSLEGRASNASDLMFRLYTHEKVPPALNEWIRSGKLWQAAKERQDFARLPLGEEVNGLIRIAHKNYAELAERGLHVVSVSRLTGAPHLEKDHTSIFQRPYIPYN